MIGAEIFAPMYHGTPQPICTCVSITAEPDAARSTTVTPKGARSVDCPEHSVPELVQAALAGNRPAWDELVHRFSPLVLSITARYRLAPADAADVSQTVWLQLVQHLSDVREPRALPGWIMTTVRNECIRLLRAQRRIMVLDPQMQGGLLDEAVLSGGQAGSDEDLLRQERHEALLAGFAELPQRHRDLLLLLLADPPLTYSEIGARLEIPVGAVGPTRARALDRLRRSAALAALLSSAPVHVEVK
jgi:RNA polymerase sigma factor (sigma-70 family)